MSFEILILKINDVVLMDRGMLVFASWGAFWFPYEIQEDLSHLIFARKLSSTVVDPVVMVVPNSDHFGSKRLHLFVMRVILRNFIL